MESAIILILAERLKVITHAKKCSKHQKALLDHQLQREQEKVPGRCILLLLFLSFKKNNCLSKAVYSAYYRLLLTVISDDPLTPLLNL